MIFRGRRNQSSLTELKEGLKKLTADYGRGVGGINRKPRSFMRRSGKCYCYKTKIHRGILLDHINSQNFPNIKTISYSFINLEIEG